jgi:hypothetical protein
MRIAVATILLASSAPAFADGDCTGADAATEQCSALWPTRHGKKPFSLAMGWAADSFDPAGHTFSTYRKGYADSTGQFEGNGLSPIHGNGLYIDVRLHATPHFYAGVDLRAAWGDAPRATFALRGGQTMQWDSATLMAMAGVAGTRVPIGRISLRGELVAGIHGTSLGTMDGNVGAYSVVPLVEPRLGVDVWLSPWWALEGFAGTNLLDRSEHVFGLGLAMHGQAFDGAYR